MSGPITKYCARFGEVFPVEIVRETAQFVVLGKHQGNRREKKLTDWCSYFDTHQQAVEWITDKLRRELESAEAGLKHRKTALEKHIAKFAKPEVSP